MRNEHEIEDERAQKTTRWTRNAPEEVQEPERFEDDANKRPLEEHEQNSPNKAQCTPQLLFPREEVERLLRPDDQREPGQEQNLHVRRGRVRAQCTRRVGRE